MKLQKDIDQAGKDHHILVLTDIQDPKDIPGTAVEDHLKMTDLTGRIIDHKDIMQDGSIGDTEAIVHCG